MTIAQKFLDQVRATMALVGINASNDPEVVRVINGATAVSDQGQAPSSYSGIVALSTTAASETIATGAKSVVVTNLSSTATDYAILAFGTDAADAETNLASGGWTVRANSEKAKAVPADAGGIAYKSAAGTPSIELTWG